MKSNKRRSAYNEFEGKSEHFNNMQIGEFLG